MTEPRAQRTLVKSPPELWAEISDVTALAQHLGEFGEIRIVRLDPETTVAWEGDTARGTVELQESGWGTKVTLTAELKAPEAPNVRPAAASGGNTYVRPVEEPEPVAPEPVAVAEPEPEPEPAPEPPAAAAEPVKKGFFARLFGGGRKQAELPVAPLVAEPVRPAEPEAVEEPPAPEPPAPEPEPVAAEPEPEPDELRPSEPVADRTPDHDHAVAVLTSVLDDLGSAHHRPFSR